MIKGLEHQSYKERPEGWGCAAWRREGSSMCTSSWSDGVKSRAPGLSQRCPGEGQDTAQNERRFCLNIRNTFLLCWWPIIDTGCPGRLCSLHPWGYSKVIWIWAREIGSRWSCWRETSRGPFQPQHLCDSHTSICSSIIHDRINKHHLHTWSLTSHQKILMKNRYIEDNSSQFWIVSHCMQCFALEFW